jgi:hypothetical protein
VLWVDAGVGPQSAALPGPVRVVDAEAAGALSGADIPDRVVVGCDWTTRADDDTGPAELLLDLLDRAAATGPTPRYGVRVERGGGSPAPGEALARTLDRYWSSWRASGCTRLNAVRYTEPTHHAQAVGAVRAILSGALDGMRGQVLNVAHGRVA